MLIMSESKTAQHNVDEAEVRKFSELSSKWWDRNAEFKSLHDLNPLRLDYIRSGTPLAGMQVLDVGCGGGILSESMALAGAKVTGIDMAEPVLNIARIHAMESGVEVDYRRIPAEQLAAESPGHWDIVTCMEMLEHVPDPASAVRACGNLVRPGGTVYFSTINRTPKSFLFAIVGAEYLLNLLPRGTHQFEQLIRPSELYGWCEASGLLLDDMTGVHYNPLVQRYWLGPGVDVNYIVRAVRTAG